MLQQFFFVVGLSLIHAYSGKIMAPKDVPRSAGLSFAGGVSVAYVFVLIFPELEEAQQTLSPDSGGFIEHHAYLVALAGLAAFYGLERLVKEERKQANKESTGIGVFWVHMVSFILYNALIGYLLVYREVTGLALLFYFLAMAAHFLVNDHALMQHHRHVYMHRGRWILSVAVFAGWLLGIFVELRESLVAVLFAFLAGGIILNILKEELPEERQSNFIPFAIGIVIYSIVLLGA